ncbi:uncharacterized protein zgc:194621 isoform X2 [Pseudoliparis swirei]|uniref:uncharacterized protein zgc:194621 isoform X2 n=1 Tax=Pseudoliparis swirei TaxID=2059687 RepID=UPI0024BD6174|nr:uncharacterized protein zgc:194621 isoform X2 [Pseudoliparis swirei]
MAALFSKEMNVTLTLKMQDTKVIKSKPGEVTRKPLELPTPGKVRAVTGSELKVPAAHKNRATSCAKRPQPERREATAGALKPSPSERRSRSSSTTAKTTTKPDYRGATSSSVKRAAVTPKGRERSAAPGQKGALQPGGARHERHEAFTVIAPNPKTRRDTQRKAEAELVALEELRLSRAMAYVSINPSSVGGCLSLEEVRLKQQQELMRAKRNQKPVRKQPVEQTAVLNITSKYQ